MDWMSSLCRNRYFNYDCLGWSDRRSELWRKEGEEWRFFWDRQGSVSRKRWGFCMFDRIINNMKEGKIGEGREAIVQEIRVMLKHSLSLQEQ